MKQAIKALDGCVAVPIFSVRERTVVATGRASPEHGLPDTAAVGHRDCVTPLMQLLRAIGVLGAG